MSIPYIRVFCVIRMSLRTPSPTVYDRCKSAAHIYTTSYWIYMVRVNTSPAAAEMIKLKTYRYLSDQFFIEQAMNSAVTQPRVPSSVC